MQIESRKLRSGFKNGAFLVLSVLYVFVGLGCTSTHKTTKTETTVTQSNDAVANDTGVKSATTESASKDQQSSATTTTTKETKPAGHPGILSSTVHAIGWVIALPFRLVGGLIGWIF